MPSTRKELLCYNVASTGSLSTSIVHPREVHKSAILNAAAIVVGHNHSSGDPAPSREDREVTRPSPTPDVSSTSPFTTT